jgi:7-cyano-7-deazaguanine reductase
MVKSVDSVDHLKSLGSKETTYDFEGPHAGMLETFANTAPPGQVYQVELNTNEFTSLCPKTNQPDFGEISVRYSPREHCVETKSLKLYLFAFRNQGSFMESIVNRIAKDLFDVLHPRGLTVVGKFAKRGGVEVVVTATLFTPEQYSDAITEAVE